MPGDFFLYFSDIFGVTPEEAEAYGSFNVSLATDLPLFIDPFLLFNSPMPEYQKHGFKLSNVARRVCRFRRMITIERGKRN